MQGTKLHVSIQDDRQQFRKIDHRTNHRCGPSCRITEFGFDAASIIPDSLNIGPIPWNSIWAVSGPSVTTCGNAKGIVLTNSSASAVAASRTFCGAAELTCTIAGYPFAKILSERCHRGSCGPPQLAIISLRAPPNEITGWPSSWKEDLMNRRLSVPTKSKPRLGKLSNPRTLW